MYKILICENVKAIRLHGKISQSKLAKLCGVTSVCINKIESGKSIPSLIVASKLCEVFRMSLSELVFGSYSHAEQGIQNIKLIASQMNWSDISSLTDHSQKLLRSIINMLHAADEANRGILKDNQECKMEETK